MRQLKPWTLSTYMLIAILVSAPALVAQTGHTHEEESQPSNGLEWVEGFSLIVTDAADIHEAWAIEESIRNAGGRIGLVFGDKVMMGWLPDGLAQKLAARSNIAHASGRPLWSHARGGLDMRHSLSQDEIDGIRFFNQAASGKLAVAREANKSMKRSRAGSPTMRADAFEAPPLDYESYRQNLLANGIDEQVLANAGISIVEQRGGGFAPSPGNSDYIAGKVTLNVIFVESVGGLDPNLYTWAGADKTTIKNEIAAGLAWLVSTAQNPSTYKVPLVFNVRYQTRYTNYEPILHPSSQDYLWINQIMFGLGYGTGDKFARTTAYNTAERIARNTNWAATSFVGYNPSPASSTFTDGYFAYAYLRGPYSQMLFRNNGWGVGSYDKVNTHELGHLLGGAPDEYYQAGYGGCSGTGRSANNVYNGNCERTQPNAISCLMRNNAWDVCGWTPGHFGWQHARSMNINTGRTDTGLPKLFFAAGEAIQYRVRYCIEGPKIGTQSQPVRVRFRADYFGSGLDTSSTVADDTGWGTAGSVSPATSTGQNCYYTWWNRSVPAAAKYGQAVLSVQLEIGGMGRQAKPKTARFYVMDGAATTQPSPLVLSGPALAVGDLDEGPFTELLDNSVE